MRTSVKLLLGGIFITVSFFLAGCTGTGYTTYYSSYYDPYPYYHRGYRSVRHYHHYKPRPPGHRPPNIGRPVQLPSRPTPRPMPRQRR